MTTEVTVTYLEMRSPNAIIAADPARIDPALGEVNVWRAGIASPELNRFFYTAVGGPWRWVDRLSWRYDQWLEYLQRPGIETWVGAVRGTPFGYCELERTVKGPGTETGPSVEIVYFGLLPAFVGRGLGGVFLTEMLHRAWNTVGVTPGRVWLHTCSLDGPAALSNYTARGFRVCKTETEWRELSGDPPGPWPGAYSGKTPVDR